MRRVLFLASANNGLTQRAAAALRTAGHSVRTAVVGTEDQMLQAVTPHDFDVIICPFLKTKIPTAIWKKWPTVIIHPGPVGDRGPSSLDWAITQQEPLWGVTALSAVEDMDAGPIWATRNFDMPGLRKSAVYNGPVADAAVACILEAVAKAADHTFTPTPPDKAPRAVASAQLRDSMMQKDRAISWDSPSDTIIRAIHAADGQPGLATTIGEGRVYLFDAHPAPAPHRAGAPGTVIGRRHSAVRIATGDGSIWVGHARARSKNETTFKLPATHVLARPEYQVDIAALPVESADQFRNIDYRRIGANGEIGVLTFDFYNGAMSTGHCKRLLHALRFAKAQATRVLVLRGGWTYFSNGIHLNVIEAANNPAREAWHNIKAINAVCREITTCSSQVVISAFTGNAGAGGVMLPLGADIVVARDGVVLNPHYQTMGLHGSELHTYTLPRRVGTYTAHRLTTGCLPIGADTARAIGLLDEIGPREQTDFTQWLTELASEYAADHLWHKMLTTKQDTLRDDFSARPLDSYEADELGEMSKDMFGDRNGFSEKRYNFVHKVATNCAADRR